LLLQAPKRASFGIEKGRQALDRHPFIRHLFIAICGASALSLSKPAKKWRIARLAARLAASGAALSPRRQNRTAEAGDPTRRAAMNAPRKRVKGC
jgi:hypothetical protein